MKNDEMNLPHADSEFVEFCESGSQQLIPQRHKNIAPERRGNLVPEGHRKLAGGRARAASEYHRINARNGIRPGGGGGNFMRAFSGAPSGAQSILSRRSGGSRCAPPPANFRDASGVQEGVSHLKLALMGQRLGHGIGNDQSAERVA